MQKIREQVISSRDLVYQHNEGEVRKRWHFEDAVSTHFPSAGSPEHFHLSIQTVWNNEVATHKH